MSEAIKSGKQVIDEFFAEIMNIKGVDKKTVEKLTSLYSEGKLTDTNIENAMGQLCQEELDTTEEKDGKD
jgi:Glu-tRNA(Gln) amidotransferase subunit E-like FAD-binding protein